MSEVALIFNGVVDNIATVDENTGATWYATMGQRYVVVDLTGVTPRPSPGWLYDGATFAPPSS